jgi:hypothetical protein
VSDGARATDVPIPGPGGQKRRRRSAMICGVAPGRRTTCCALLVGACLLASCADSSTPHTAPTTTTTSSTTTTTTPPTTLPPEVAVPDVVGMKVDLAHFYLRAAGFSTVSFNAPCSRGTAPSQSVVASLSLPGRPPDVMLGAQPLPPGTRLPKGADVGITWSGCYPAGTSVPKVVGQPFGHAVHLLHLAGLNWACYSASGPTTTTTRRPTTTTTRPLTTGAAGPTSSTSSTTTTTAAPATTTTAPPTGILSQGTKAGTLVQAGTVVALVMHHCPQ